MHPLNRTLPMCIWVNCSKSLQNFFKGALKYAFLVNKVGVNVEVHIKFHRDYQSHAKFSLGIPVQFPIPDHWGWLSDTTVTFSASEKRQNEQRLVLHLLSVKKHNQKPTQCKPKTYGLAIRQNCLATLGIWDENVVFHMENVHNRLLMLISIACV